MKTKAWVAGLLQALGIAAYILVIALFFQNANNILGRMNNFSGPLLFLSLFTFSALMCGLIAFFYPVKLFFIDDKKKKGVEVVLYMVLFLFLFLLGIFLFSVAF